MTTIETRAAEALTALQDHVRDIEADLGKFERNRVNNPSYNRPPRIELNPVSSRELTAQNEERRQALLQHVKPNLGHVYSRIPTSTGALTTAEQTAIGRIDTLVASIKTITNRADAAALVATF